jgi:steroid 5-alpha reductase family enzyme
MLRSATKSSSSFALFSSFSRITSRAPSSPFFSAWASRRAAAATGEAGVGFNLLQRLPNPKKSAACFRGTHPRRFASFASSSLLKRGETRQTKKRTSVFFERQQRQRRATRAFVSPLQFVADTTSAAFSSSAASSSPSLSVSSSMVSVAWIIGAASIVDFGIQFVGWAISSAMKTEKYYDLCGSGAFAAVAASTFACTNGEPRAALATTALLAWALRLGTFLVTRVHKDGGDKRFDGIKEDPATFGIYWFIQGIWVLVTAMPVILINANAATQGPLRALDWVGFSVFAAGLTMETVADQQKRAFKADAKNKGKYIDSGLWSISRHPNYFGEITLWTGMSMVGLSGVAKYGAGEVIGCVLSPLLVAFLITQLSGIPLLEKSADERWGNEEAYQKYKRETPKLIPFIGGK